MDYERQWVLCGRRDLHVSDTTKVLYLSPVAERGGAEVVLLNLLRYQDRAAFEPVVGFLENGPLIEEVRQLGVRTIVFPSSRFRYLHTTFRAIRSIRRFLREERIALVLSNMAMGHMYGGLAAMGTRTHAIWFQHGVPRSFIGIDFAASRIPSKAIFVYTDDARRAQARFHPAGQIILMPGGVDLTRFNPSNVPKGVVRRELGIDADTLLVACVARLQRWKGQSLFLRAASAVHSVLPKAHFLVVGGTLFGLEPDYAMQLQEEAARLLPIGSVHFLGHRDDLPEILADVDVLVHCPVTPEPFGFVILEAMAMQVPVVATRGGGPEEIVRDDETGLLVSPGESDALAAAVLRSLRNSAQRQLMGLAARRRAEELFSIEAMVRRMEESYRRVLGKG